MKDRTITPEAYLALQLAAMTWQEWQNAVIECMRKNGFRTGHFRAVRIQRADGTVYYETPVQADGKGFPDAIGLRDTRIVVAECKTGGGRVTPEQQTWLTAWHAAGAEVFIWHADLETWKEIQEVLR